MGDSGGLSKSSQSAMCKMFHACKQHAHVVELNDKSLPHKFTAATHISSDFLVLIIIMTAVINSLCRNYHFDKRVPKL